MTDVRLNVDATFGAEVEVGDNVQVDQQVGVSVKTGKAVVSKTCGIVKEIEFDAEDHQFTIVIRS